VATGGVGGDKPTHALPAGWLEGRWGWRRATGRRDGEGEEILLAVEGVDLLDVERGVGEGGVVEALDVVEEVAGEGGVGVDDGPLEAEVVVVLGDALVDGGALNGMGMSGMWMGCVLCRVKRRRLISSSVAAGGVARAEMNWKRASSS